MTDAPKMIALRWQPGAAVTIGPLMDHPDYTRYVRQDMTHPIEKAADAVERELADLRAKLAVAVEALEAVYEITVEPAETNHSNVRGWIEVTTRNTLAQIKGDE